MKGIFIHDQIEFRLEVAGDEFHQGDTLQCTISAKNHSASTRNVSGLRLELVLADLPKVRQKAENAFESLVAADLPAPGEIAPQEVRSYQCSFPLEKNAPISDKSRSLCFIFGTPDVIEYLPAAILPHRHFRQIFLIMESAFQFVLRGQKSAEGWITGKFKPPSSRRLSLVDELLLCLRFEGDGLALKYVFKVKRFEATVATVGVKKGKSEVNQLLEENEYLLSKEHINHDALQARIEEALSTVATAL